MVKVAVVLSGCGHLDGAEIRESVIALVALDRQDAEVSLFAPDVPQADVINHLTGKPMQQERNVLVEAARIARGNIQDVKKARAKDFDALVLPGGFGVAKNLSTLATQGAALTILPDVKRLILEFLEQGKPIGAICISPALLAAAVRESTEAHVTIGEDKNGLIASLGGVHQECQTKGIVIDDANGFVSCSAYMRNDRLTPIALGIEKLIETVIRKAAQT